VNSFLKLAFQGHTNSWVTWQLIVWLRDSLPAYSKQAAHLMACPVLITSVDVLDNPARFTNPLQFEIQYECILPLKDGAFACERVSQCDLLM
jgi:ASF1 like histone chaperone